MKIKYSLNAIGAKTRPKAHKHVMLIIGRVRATLGYKAPSLRLSAAGMVTILLSQALPFGTVASYAFLTTSLRKRAVPTSSVAVIASLELLSWGGAMLILFIYGMI